MTHFAPSPITLAVIRDRVAEIFTDTRRRDTLSAFDTLTKQLGIDLAQIQGDAKTVREFLADTSAVKAGLSSKRWANVCSAVRTASEEFGPKRQPITRLVPLSADWAALMASVITNEHRYGLYRLACFATSVGIAPDVLCRTDLKAFHDALEQEDRIKKPRSTLKHTISLWNMCRKSIPGWPDTILSSPFESTTYTYRLTDFPAGFQADMGAWRDRLLHPDPFDDDAPPKALKLVSVDRDERHIRRVASVLVDANVLAMEDLTGLAVLVDFDLVKQALRLLLDRMGNGSTEHVKRHATVMRSLAKYYIRSPEAQIRKMDTLCKRLSGTTVPGLRAGNREKLRQFDDPKNVQAFLHLPELQRRYALTLANPYRRAKAMERALIIAILLDTGIRRKNICLIRPDLNLRDLNSKMSLHIPGPDVKNEQELEFDLRPQTIALLKEYQSTYRSLLNGSDSPYLFPGRFGGVIAESTMYTDIKKTAMQRAGLEIHPHLFRHALAKIVVEEDSEAYMAVSRHLGHRSLRTTMTSYLGTETRMAGRKVNALLETVKTRRTS